jgi:hypothetical protein
MKSEPFQFPGHSDGRVVSCRLIHNATIQLWLNRIVPGMSARYLSNNLETTWVKTQLIRNYLNRYDDEWP